MIEIQSRRVALYARHSCELQDGSAADQLDRCRRFVRDKGGTVAGEYSDEAMSGSTMVNRPALRRLLLDADTRLFDAVCIEDLSRATRDLEDAAGIFKRLTFREVPLVSVTEGPISELHVGLKGTMNALFLRELADKTRRGQIAAIRRGRSPGGLPAYGYDMVREIGPDGEIVRGQRRINEDHAAIVMRIFEAYASGAPLKAIARCLNRDGIPSPRGGKWSAPTLLGCGRLYSGILRNNLYRGMVVYGMTRYARDPRSGRRVPRPRPPAEWLTEPAPHLRIVPDDLWERVQRRVNAPRIARRAGPRRPPPPRYVTSGITYCGRCGQRVSTAFAGWVNCQAHRRHQACDHPHVIRRADIIRITLRLARRAARNGRERIAAALAEQHGVRAHNAAAARQCAKDLERQLADIARKTNACIDLLAAGEGGDITRARIAALEQEASDIRNRMDAATAAAALPPAGDLDRMAARTATILAAAASRLINGDPADRKAMAIIRRAIGRIDVAYRGPGRKRLRVVPLLDAPGLYDLALVAVRPRPRTGSRRWDSRSAPHQWTPPSPPPSRPSTMP